MTSLDWSILWPACLAGFVVTAIHVPLGLQVLDRGIVFIDLAIAQIAGIGVVLGHVLGFEADWAVQACAFGAAASGALLFAWTDRRFADVQEAIIGTSFVLAACATLLLLAHNPHGAEHLKDLLVGQILWVGNGRIAAAACVYGLLLAILALRPRTMQSRLAFYLLFAGVITISVQLVGIYLVFASLIVPALATRQRRKGRLLYAYWVSVAGYATGIALSAAADLPTAPTIVCTMIAFAIVEFARTLRPARA